MVTVPDSASSRELRASQSPSQPRQNSLASPKTLRFYKPIFPGLLHQRKSDIASTSNPKTRNSTSNRNQDVSMTAMEEQKEKAKSSLHNVEQLFSWIPGYIDIDPISSAQLQSDLRTLDDHISQCAAQLSTLEQINQDRKVVADRFESENQNLNGLLREISRSVERSQHQIETLRKEHDQTCQVLQRTTNQKVYFEAVAIEKQDQINALQKELRQKAHDTMQQVQDHQVQMQALRAQLVVANDDLPRQRIIQQLESTVRDQEVALKKRDQTIENYKKKVDMQPTLAVIEQEARAENVRLMDELYDVRKEVQQKEQELVEAVRMRDEALKMKSSHRQSVIAEPSIVKTSLPVTSSNEHIERLITDLQHKIAVTDEDLRKIKDERAEFQKQRKLLAEEFEGLKKASSEPAQERAHDPNLNSIFMERKLSQTEPQADILYPHSPSAPKARPAFHPPPALTSSNDFPPYTPSPDLSFKAHKKTKSVLSDSTAPKPTVNKRDSSPLIQNGTSYAAAAKKPAGNYTGTLKITRPPAKNKDIREFQRPKSQALASTGVEGALHRRGKKGLENMLKKQAEQHNGQL
jgi:DNA repair exonuclease SbcCD ATPase subunit